MEKSVDHEIWMHIFQWNPDKQTIPFEHEPAFKVGDDIWTVSAINPNDYELSKVTEVVKGELWIVKGKQTIKVACYCYETEGVFRVYDYNQPLRAFNNAKDCIHYVRAEYEKKFEKLRAEGLRVYDEGIKLETKIRKENYLKGKENV